VVPDFHTAVQQAPPQAAARVNRSYERFVYWVFVSAYTDISVRASAIKNQRCCSARKARQFSSTRLNCSLFAASSSSTCSRAVRSAFWMSGLSKTSCAPAATRRLSAFGLRVRV
jgi:hypothetical protein